MKMIKPLIALLFLVVGSVIFYPIGGILLTAAFLMLWIDKIIFGELKTPLHFGIEFYSIPSILIGIAYGPLTGFLFAFFVIPIIGGIFDTLYPLLLGANLLDTGWEPFFPSPESFISGIIAVIAGVFSSSFTFLGIVATCMGIRFVLSVMRDAMFDMPTNIIAYTINFLLAISIAITFQSFFVSILSV
jgi:hypothetical protein